MSEHSDPARRPQVSFSRGQASVFNWQDVSLEKNNISEYGNIRVVNDTCEIYNTLADNIFLLFLILRNNYYGINPFLFFFKL